MIVTHETSRGQSEADSLADLVAMVAAAEADPAVAKVLPANFLKISRERATAFEAMTSGKGKLETDKLLEGDHLAEHCHALARAEEDIRGLSQGLVNGALADAFAHGTKISEGTPDALVEIADKMAHAIHDHAALAKDMRVDKQLAHDLAHEADAVSAFKKHHGELVRDRSKDTHARDLAKADAQARAHFIRVRAGVAHRGDEAALAAFASPIAHHRVVHRSKAAPPTTGAPVKP